MKNNIIILGLSALLLLGISACDDWLTLKPEDDILLDDFWSKESDVEAVLASCYKGLCERSSMERMMAWGELRSDNIIPVMGFPNNKEIYGLFKMLIGDLDDGNAYASWSSFYTVINYCNTLLYYAPGVMEKDNNFTKRDLELVTGEAMTIRALAYFYLTRAFRDVPWIDTPSVDDSQNYSIAQSSDSVIIDKIITDLEYVKKNNLIRDSYGSVNYDKGRITRSALNAILADVYLWKGDYPKCVSTCNDVLANSKLELVKESTLFLSQVFYRGNSTESIFELQFDDDNLKNEAVKELYGYSNILGYFYFPPALAYDPEIGYTGQASPFNYKLPDQTNESVKDIRAKSFYVNAGGGIFWPFKYVGANAVENVLTKKYQYYMSPSSVTFNWILYRLPEVMLMKAEALVEMGGNDAEALALVNSVYSRSNPGEELVLSNYGSKEELAKLVLRERQREFLFEGKRWFDLVRLSRREGSVSSLNRYVTVKMDAAIAPLGAVVMDAMYMPVSRREMEANKELVQNKFYDKKDSDYER